MRSRWLLITLLITALLPGCEFGRRFVDKPWAKGTYIPAAVCTLVGAGTGAYIQEIRTGESFANVQQPDGSVTRRRVEDDPDHWQGALIGGAIGAVVCGLAGHYLFDPEVSTPAPPPPTPTPTPEPVPTPVARRIVLRGVYFDFDRSTIRPASRPVLDAAVQVLMENPNVRVAVEGHTDSTGPATYNDQLSVRRAEAVFRFLVNHGIAPERMEVRGYGESRPVATNDTASGRAQNRRTELRVAQQGGTQP